MQSTNQQIDTLYDIDEAPAASAVRPEPLVTERVQMSGGSAHPRDDDRSRLADSFRWLGRGLSAGAAHRQARAFYRSSGHEWTRALK